MKIEEFVKSMDMKVITDSSSFERDINGIFICDLMSFVMSQANKNDAWITVHTNINILAVATITEVSCIIIPHGIEVEISTIKKANAEGITILSSKMTAYEIAAEASKLI